MLVTYPVATVLLGVMAATAGGPVRSGALLWGSLYGISQAIGVYWFYAAVSAGPISVVSPLAAVLNAAVPVAVGVALGERPGQIASVGVVLAMFAVILVSRASPADEDVRTHRFTSKVAWLTVGSGVAFGLDFVLLHQAPAECRLWPLFFARAAATVLVFAVAAMSNNLQLPTRTPLRLAVAAALLDTCANITMLLAIQKWMLSLASILISLYPATTVILAIIVLRERLTRWQALGMILAAVSVSMIAAT
ncbi:MAG: EamA family transporter [Mycobacterium sp.]|uniref:EamA family transporter n=1 Tax=Mycobacterium sp. TaxID=1785 RepID=UPI003C760B69